MKQLRFEAEIARAEHVPEDIARERVYGDMRERVYGAVRERVYGAVRVVAEWPEDLASPEIRVPIEVSGELDVRDGPAYVELFFHDAFLILNLAAPGSFGGTVSITGGELRARELTFSARLFEYAAPLRRLPIERVAAWYEALEIGTRQRAYDGTTTALFELLHLARASEDEEVAIVRLARAAEALVGQPESLRRLFELRDELARGRAPLYHPMYDDALDPSIVDATAEWIEVADLAAAVVIGALQERIGGN